MREFLTKRHSRRLVVISATDRIRPVSNFKKKELQNEICFLEFRPKDHLDISFDINERSELLHNIFLSFSNKKKHLKCQNLP